MLPFQCRADCRAEHGGAPIIFPSWLSRGSLSARLVSYLILLLSIILSYLIHTSMVLSFRPGLGVWLLALALAIFPRVLFCFDVHMYMSDRSMMFDGYGRRGNLPIKTLRLPFVCPQPRPPSLHAFIYSFIEPPLFWFSVVLVFCVRGGA